MSEDLTIGAVVAGAGSARPEAGWLRRSIFSLDAYLRRQHGIVEFTARPDCILRIAPAVASHALILSDGTRIQPGDPLLDLHLWNEHVPAIPSGGVTLRWAAAAARCARASLRALAAETRAGHVPNFIALRGCLRFDGRLLQAPFAGCGFDAVVARAHAPGEWLHEVGEVCLVAMLLWAFNPAGLSHAHLMRPCRFVWMSRTRLLERHGRLLH
ncbi:MAG TPA: hypothetical protein VEU53_11685 [Stellaceae bacterium]|nr:hypothetical protein [Stellaceae bacterium]